MTTKQATYGLDFRLFLQEELIRRCRGNSQYSLRSFAKLLQTEPSYLSKILRGKRSVTPRYIRKASPLLNISEKKSEQFCRRHERKQLASEDKLPAKNYEALAADSLNFLSDWYHYAILQLIDIKDFQPDPSKIAGTLAITVMEVRLSELAPANRG